MMIFARRRQQDVAMAFGHAKLKRITGSHKYLGVWFTESFSFRDHIKRVKGKAWRALHDVKRIVGVETGATTLVVLRLYEALVRPILEYACCVWDCERPTYKRQLDGVQRGALLAATGALHTTSTEALQVYCNIPSLSDRRELATILSMEKAARLDHSHPLALRFSQ